MKKIRSKLRYYSNLRSMFRFPIEHRRASTRKKPSFALREYSELFEHSPVSYFIIDENGIIENVNERGSLQLGIEKSILIGRTFSNFLAFDLDKERFEAHKKKAVSGHGIEKMEGKIIRNSGDAFCAIIKSKVMLDEHSQFKHLLSMVTDISAIKDHEHQMELQLQKLEELNLLKSKFIGMASHEFRTPLTSMLSSTTLIEKYAMLGETANLTKHLLRMKSSIHRLVTILDEFLSIEKLESGKVEVNRINLNLKHFCQDLIEEVTPVLKKGQKVHYFSNGDHEITGDGKILHHILLNLLSNASKYSAEDTEVLLSTDVSTQLITITITDRGIGIPENEQENIFSSFFRAQNTGNIEGTGLGLNIVKRYVELLDGNITFFSKVKEGTTFVVELPNAPTKMGY